MTSMEVSEFEALRQHLMSVAYRLTGTVADAEDIVQEAWLRWDSQDTVIADPRAWLTTVVSRLGLDKLRGTTSGSGGSPAAGTSDESTAGGVDTLYGHAAGAALGSPAAVGRPIPVPTANTAAARHDTERKKAIVCAE